jgi:hypothetical protein
MLRVQKPDKLLCEDTMPVVAGHKFYFAEKVPLAFSFVFSLLFANTLLMLLLAFAGKYFLPKHAPWVVSWYDDHSILIQFVLLGILAVILVIFRKRVRYFGRN